MLQGRVKHHVLNEGTSLAKLASGSKRLNPFTEVSFLLFIPCYPSFLRAMKLSPSERPRLGGETARKINTKFQWFLTRKLSSFLQRRETEIQVTQPCLPGWLATSQTILGFGFFKNCKNHITKRLAIFSNGANTDLRLLSLSCHFN